MLPTFAAETTFHGGASVLRLLPAGLTGCVVAAGRAGPDATGSREGPKSGAGQAESPNPLIQQGCCGRSGSGPNGGGATPLRKLNGDPPWPVAGSPSKNGKGFHRVLGSGLR